MLLFLKNFSCLIITFYLSIVGYADEGATDFYATNPSSSNYSYSLQESVAYDDPVGFGAYVDCDEYVTETNSNNEGFKINGMGIGI